MMISTVVPDVSSSALVSSRNCGQSGKQERRRLAKLKCTHLSLSGLLVFFLSVAVNCAPLNETGRIITVENVEIIETPVSLWNEKADQEILSTDRNEIEDQDLLEQIFSWNNRVKREIKHSEDNGANGGNRKEGDYHNNLHQISEKIGKVTGLVESIRSELNNLTSSMKLQPALQRSNSAQYALCIFQPSPSNSAPHDNLTTTNNKTDPAACVNLPTTPKQENSVYESIAKIFGWANSDSLRVASNSNTTNVEETTALISASAAVTDHQKEECEEGHVACQDGKCILKTLWCDAKIDCDDSSDEEKCSCIHRIDKIRICDNYMDCPNGEDENGCHGCPKNTHFSCASSGPHDTRAPKADCLQLIMRCDGKEDCSSGSDEKECYALLEKPINSGQVDMQSHVSGYLHINSHGQWFPLCTYDKKAAVSACKAESHPDVEWKNVQIDMVPLDKNESGDILVLFPSSLCKGNSVAYVECPAPKCGTRILDEAPIESPKDKRTISGRIVGGTLSKPTAWPFLVAVFRDGRFHCGGSLIGDAWVLTAAHCVHDYKYHFYEIQAGMLRRRSFSPQEQTRVVTHVIVHNEYNREAMINDLAMLKINPPVRMSRWARTICLPPAGLPEPGTNCIAVGWGAVKEQGYDPDQIHEVDVPILENCKHLEDREGVEICAGWPEGGKDACKGDSGGPLLCRVPQVPEKWYVAGVVSHGEGCARPNEPGAYTRVGIFLNWISHHIANESALPSEVPIDKCPSRIECSKVGGRCLSASMVCDKVVDCLEAEDELDCKKRDDESKFRAETSAGRPIILHDEETDRSRKEHVQKANQILDEEGMLEEDSFPDILTRWNDTVYILETKNETAITLNEPYYGTSTTAGPPSVLEATLEPLYSSPSESSAKGVEDYGGGEEEEADPSSGESTTDIGLTESKTTEDTTAATQNKHATTEETMSTRTEDTTMVTNTDDIATTTKNEMNETDDTWTTLTESDTTINDAMTTAMKTIHSSTKSPEQEKIQVTTPRPTSPLSISVPNATYGANTSIYKGKQPQSEFHCSHHHKVPFNCKCDGFKDCEDGSDEMYCSCKDYLLKIEPNLICNGELNCADRSDESSCDEYHCSLSKKCVKRYQICDRRIDCHKLKDEKHCTALLSGPFVIVDDDHHAVFRKKGYLSYKDGNSWYHWCLKTRAEGEKLAADTCAGLGFSHYARFSIRPVFLSSLPIYHENKHMQLKRGSSGAPALMCDGLWIECGNRIYTPPSKSISPCGNCSWPWFSALYLDGNYLCGATIIDQQRLITSKSCVQNINLNYHFLGVLMGTNRQLALKAPYEQIRRIILIQKIKNVALLFMDAPILITEQVIPLPLKERFEQMDDIQHCMALGPDNSISRKLISIQFKPISCRQNTHFCLEPVCSSPDLHCKVKSRTSFPWSGTLACQDKRGSWFPLAVFFEPFGSCGFKTPLSLENLQNLQPYLKYHLWRTPRIPFALVPPPCDGLRCPLGRCIKKYNLCDGVAHCRDRSDESYQYITSRKCCFKFGDSIACVCAPNQIMCRDGMMCVEKSKFCDGVNDCADASDEPVSCNFANCKCRAYLTLANPHKICDGIAHCRDKSDEIGCPCTPNSYRCVNSGPCIPNNFFCDGTFDCPHGDDEVNCVGMRTKRSSSAGRNVLMETFGNLHVFCRPPDMNATSLHALSRDLCRQMGFLGNTVLQPSVGPVYKFRLNNKTTIEMSPSSRSVMELEVPECPRILFVDCGKPFLN
ncbi:Hypothetical predicted protein [Cloeon dipterum]|uniref:Peptidase S1 domain-containing protein n=1 Tax=Cloeon dipterum TaxID=197152 RepID=A0A8S1DF96_9INSE|nr:Hypothetical predicted protein [Cloeon dipterum]